MIKLRTLLLYNYVYIILTIIAIGYSYFMMNCYPYQSKYKITDNTIDGYIHNYKIDGNKLSIVLIGKEKIIVNYYFESKHELEAYNFELGDYINVSGKMNEPRSATVFNLFDYKKYLYHNHIFFLMTADNIKLTKNNSRLRYTIKQSVVNHINSIGKSSTYVKALVIGDDDGFSDEINKSYQFNGVSHLFAISGSHISFLAVILLWVLKRLKVEENKRYYTVVLFLLFYMFLTDYAGSVMRAVAFFTLLSLNKMYYFNISTINILQLTLFVLLLFDSALLYDIGFQFSFLISLYLILYQSLINSTHNYLKQTLLISLIAFLVSVPICINNFFQINLLSPIINVFFVPYVSFILFPLSFLCMLFPFLDLVTIFFINVLEYISIFLSNIKIGEIILAKPSFLVIMLYYFLITLSIRGMYLKKYYCFVIISLLIVIHHNVNYFNKYPYLVFIDVGQGDSIFINLPHNQGSILVDTGGKLNFGEPWQDKQKAYKIGEDTIIPYLKSIGINKLDYLILTHGDEDHMGESNDIVTQYKVDNVLLNDGSLVELEASLIRTLDKLHIPYNFGKEGDIIECGEYSFNILNPSTDINENDNSLVLYTKISSYNILLTGDISSKTEKKITSAYPNLKVDILKLGHHGSITSTSELFLDTIKPKYGIVEVGLNNRFNHPSKVIIERLRKRNIKILQTSVIGSIKINIRANDVTIMPALT